MSLRIYPISSARWAELAGTRRPIDLTRRPEQHRDPGTRMREEHARIRAEVHALLAERAHATG